MRNQIRAFLSIALTPFLLMFFVGSSLQAHDDSLPEKAQAPAHTRENMKRFAEDHHHNENLPAQSVTTCISGSAGNYPCSNVDLMAFLPTAQIGGGNGNDIWGWTDPQNGNEYALMGLTTGTAFVDISDPVNPVFLGHLPPHAGVQGSSWRDIKTYNNHAFIGSEAANSGMQVVDLTQLRNITTPPMTITETAFYTGFSRSHNIVINEDSGYAYAVGTNSGNCNRGIHFVDIVVPANPQSAGCFGTDGYTHDAQCVNYQGPDAAHFNKEICFAYNEDTLTIVDVSNKSAPVQLSRTTYALEGYTHQGWLTEDHQYLLMDDELDERDIAGVTNTRTLIWDVSDLDSPVHDGDYIAAIKSIDHNQYIIGDYSYQANYRAGLRILDISDIANGNLSEVGYFDIYPTSDGVGFDGAWSVYPFFESGNVVISGIEQGLFIVRPNLAGPDDPPVVNLLNPVDNDPTPQTGIVQIQISATDTEDADGTLTVEWNVDGGPWQPTIYNSPDHTANWDSGSVVDGAHVINARAIDSSIQEGSDSSNVTTQNGTPKFTIDSVTTNVVGGRGNRNTGHALVIVSDDGGNPLDSVFVEGSFFDGWNGTRNDTTDGNSEAVFNTPRVKNLTSIEFCVDLATKAGWELDIAGSMLCSNGGGGASGTVKGRVSDAVTIAGITNAAVSTDTGQSDTTDAFGDYSIGGVPVGNRTVSVTASGYDGDSAAATVSDGAETFVDFALTAGTTSGAGAIKGTVYSGGGGKLSDVTVQVLGGTSSTTNKGGKYNIQNVPAGSQRVIASRDGYMSQPQDITVVPGSTVTLNFTLAPE